MVQRAEMIMADWRVACELVSLYFPTLCLSAHSDFIGSRVYAYLGVSCHLHCWQNDQGLLRATVVTREWNGHQIRVSTHS